MRLNIWKNATSQDLLAIDKQISSITSQITKLTADVQNASTAINQCETEKSGLFKMYNCKGNTGRTLNDWYELKENGETQLATLRKQLTDLKSDRSDALEAIKQAAIAQGASAQAAEEIAEAQSAKSQASAAQAKNVGLWVGVGVLGIGALALIYMKVIKKK